MVELAEKTMGIIGFGRIGQQVAKIADALGMKVLLIDCDCLRSLDVLTGVTEQMEHLYQLQLHFWVIAIKK